jgi:hypothetical protein
MDAKRALAAAIAPMSCFPRQARHRAAKGSVHRLRRQLQQREADALLLGIQGAFLDVHQLLELLMSYAICGSMDHAFPASGARMASGLNRDPVVDAQEQEGHPQPAVIQADQDGETLT